MTPRVWILGIVCVLLSPFMYFVARYLFESPFVHPYMRTISSFFSVPSYKRANEKHITDFGSGTTLAVLCERGTAECVMTIPRLTDLAQIYTGLTIRLVTVSDRFFSSDFPQIQYSHFDGLPPMCVTLPQFVVINNGEIVADSCHDDDWFEKIK